MTALLTSVRRRWELWLLAMSLAILIPTLLYGTLLASPDALAGSARELSAELESRLIQPPAPLPPAVPAMRRISAAFASPGDAPERSPWAFHPEPEIRVNVEILPAPPPPRRLHVVPPTGVLPVAEPGRMILTWKDAPREENNAKPTGYHVYRRRGAGDDFTRLTTEPVEERTFTDGTVEPGVAYAYAVSAVTDDTRVADGESGRSEAREVRACALLRLELKAGMVLEGTPAAQVRIHRFHEGRWWEKDYVVLEGASLGRVERFWRDGRVVEVDFRTGATVKGISPYEAQRSIAGEVVDVTLWKLAYADAKGLHELKEE